VHERQRVVGKVLKILGETQTVIEFGNRAFSKPSFGEQYKPSTLITLGD